MDKAALADRADGTLAEASAAGASAIRIEPATRPSSSPPPPSEGSGTPDLVRGTPDLFINRELSWLEFNQRVLDEARDRSVPLLERLKFVSICASNLDEFFMVRVAGLVGQRRDRVHVVASDGMSPTEQLAAIAKRVGRMRNEMSELLLEDLLPELAGRGVRLIAARDVGVDGRAQLRQYFRDQVLPVLTPLAIDPGHPFPHLRNKSLNLIAMLSGSHRQAVAPAFAMVQVPGVLPRLVRVTTADEGTKAAYVLLDDLIALHIGDLFPGFRCLGAWPFRVVRNFDLSIDEEEAEDLLESVKQEVRRRDRGNAVSVLIDGRAHQAAQDMLREALRVDTEYVFTVDGPLNLPDLVQLGETLDQDPELRDPAFTPQLVPPFRHEEEPIFAVIAKRDVLLHHPYESFDPVVHFIEEAATDPDVLAIKQTLYRTSGDSPIVKALMRAADHGKQVTALVEIKARFDEENNIQWARKLEEAGVHVVYGLLGLKTHAKAALVVRRENGELKRYVHLGTGNYNPSTARLYTDLSFFTARPDIGEDASSLFNLLTSCTAPATWRKLIVAPLGLHERVLGLIEREAAAARAGRPARIVAKMNSLVDPDVILALYRASQAGVRIDLMVRGICCLRPGLPGVSDNIRVSSIVDRFLEHARIFVFEADGAQEVYCASADWMQRNFHRRVEVMFPVEDPVLKARIVEEILGTEMRDNMKRRTLRADGHWHHARPSEGEHEVRAQRVFLNRARDAAARADAKVRHERPFIVRPVRNRPTKTPDGLDVEPAPSRDSVPEGLLSVPPPAPGTHNNG
ncbi:polyphosphate kinase 1 [Sandaracinus amylolyticus]|uniref:polyphosphate kinase 1 n=1 Tax=Sandaracinus amylolyticus TaxID=927083 RepID=UPI001EFFB9B7|nr:polyphosphate kinase 1 [Sandaracinus amylolyticus]